MMASLSISIPKGRVKCPWMALPIPGERPFILPTEWTRAALRGTTVTDAALIEVKHERYGTIRALEVTHRPSKFSRVHGRVIFYDRCYSRADQINLRSLIREWAEAQRERMTKKLTGNGTVRAQKVAVLIRRLEKERKALYLHIPRNPLFPSEYRYEGDHYRDAEWTWYEQKSTRKRLARIAGMVLKDKVTTVRGYKMLREAGFEFVTFGQQQVHRGKRRHESQQLYWKHLPDSVRGVAASASREREYEYGPDEGNEYQRHRKAQVGYLACKRQAESIDAQIVALRELI